MNVLCKNAFYVNPYKEAVAIHKCVLKDISLFNCLSVRTERTQLFDGQELQVRAVVLLPCSCCCWSVVTVALSFRSEGSEGHTDSFIVA